MKLTEKQRRFADEYIISGNATQAAISAGYSKRTAKSVGSENLTLGNILTKDLNNCSQKRLPVKKRFWNI